MTYEVSINDTILGVDTLFWRETEPHKLLVTMRDKNSVYDGTMDTELRLVTEADGTLTTMFSMCDRRPFMKKELNVWMSDKTPKRLEMKVAEEIASLSRKTWMFNDTKEYLKERWQGGPGGK